jgi:hypothetical protein
MLIYQRVIFFRIPGSHDKNPSAEVLLLNRRELLRLLWQRRRHGETPGFSGSNMFQWDIHGIFRVI